MNTPNLNQFGNIDPAFGAAAHDVRWATRAASEVLADLLKDASKANGRVLDPTQADAAVHQVPAQVRAHIEDALLRQLNEHRDRAPEIDTFLAPLKEKLDRVAVLTDDPDGYHDPFELAREVRDVLGLPTG